MSLRKIVVEIDCGELFCDNCEGIGHRMRNSCYYCRIFGEDLNLQRRLPACLDAEREATDAK